MVIQSETLPYRKLKCKAGLPNENSPRIFSDLPNKPASHYSCASVKSHFLTHFHTVARRNKTTFLHMRVQWKRLVKRGGPDVQLSLKKQLHTPPPRWKLSLTQNPPPQKKKELNCVLCVEHHNVPAIPPRKIHLWLGRYMNSTQHQIKCVSNTKYYKISHGWFFINVS